MEKITIRDRRIALGLTQKEVADYSGISLPHYQKLEYGNFPLARLALGRALRLSRLLDVSIMELENADDYIEDTGA